MTVQIRKSLITDMNMDTLHRQWQLMVPQTYFMDKALHTRVSRLSLAYKDGWSMAGEHACGEACKRQHREYDQGQVALMVTLNFVAMQC